MLRALSRIIASSLACSVISGCGSAPLETISAALVGDATTPAIDGSHKNIGSATFTGRVVSTGPTQIGFQLDRPGRVSISIFDSTGKVVRTLSAAEPMTAGTHIVAWDGRDDGGALVAAGSYRWKLLQTGGLKASYVMSLQSSLPIGPGTGSPEREIGIGNHRGPTSVAVDQTSIYASSGHGETTSGMLKMDFDGRVRIWSAHQPDISLGRVSLGIMGGNIFGLQNDARIGVQGVNQPNWPWTRVGPFPDQPNNLDYVGRSMDVLWPGAARPGPDDWFTRPDGMMPMDMAVSDQAGTPQLAVSYLDQNAVQRRNPQSGAVLDTIPVQQPTGVAFDLSGNLLVATGTTILRYARGSATPATVVTGLVDPYRIDVDPSSGDILVAERGTSQRIKRFSSTGTLRATYGANGGRQYGLYDPSNFKMVSDIAATGDGGFLVSEFTAPRRIVRFDGAGRLVREWFAGSTWVPYAAPDPSNPAVVWAAADYGELTRLILDYANNTWRVHSVYSIPEATRNLPNLQDVISGGGTGLAVWKPRRVGGHLFLARDASNSAQFAVLRVDEVNWRIVPAVLADLNEERGPSSIWTDDNGDGVPQAAERRVYGAGWYIYHSRNLRSDDALNYYALNEQGGGFVRIRMTGLNSLGIPVYEALRSPSAMIQLQLPPGALNARGESNVYDSAHHLAFGPDGSVYSGLGIGPVGFAQVRSAMVARWTGDGQPSWNLSQSISGGIMTPDIVTRPGVLYGRHSKTPLASPMAVLSHRISMAAYLSRALPAQASPMSGIRTDYG